MFELQVGLEHQRWTSQCLIKERATGVVAQGPTHDVLMIALLVIYLNHMLIQLLTGNPPQPLPSSHHNSQSGTGTFSDTFSMHSTTYQFKTLKTNVILQSNKLAMSILWNCFSLIFLTPSYMHQNMVILNISYTPIFTYHTKKLACPGHQQPQGWPCIKQSEYGYAYVQHPLFIIIHTDI